MKRKCLAIGIILLFAGTCIIPSTTSQPVSRNIITVDDEPGDADYTSIKEALNHSNPGDTIEVYSGTYYEYHIIVDIRGIILKGVAQELGGGNDTGKPIMNTTQHYTIFNVRSDDVTITNFVMIDYSEHVIINELTRIWGNNCTFSSNDVSGGFVGVFIGGDEYYPENHHPIMTHIVGNTFDNTSTGVYLSGPYGNISYNRFRGCNYRAIRIWDGSNSSIIKYNIISNCSTGIEYTNGSDSIISHNIISAGTGIELSVFYGKNNLVITNAFQDCGTGIRLFIAWNLVQIKQNNFINNTQDIRFLQPFLLKYNLVFHRIFNGNYYDTWSEPSPKLIWGGVIILFFSIPWLYRDLQPAQEPYDIGV